jgi:hypothetical protein
VELECRRGERGDHGGHPSADHHAVPRRGRQQWTGGYSGGELGRRLETKGWLLENEGALSPALV